MSATLLRMPHGIDWQVPPGILRHRPREAEPEIVAVWPEVSGNQAPTYLHPIAVATVAGGHAWLLLVCWVVFAGHGYMSLALAMATLISSMMSGLLMAGSGRSLAPWQRP